MQITKAIIPVAGFGTRRLPITKAIEKCMLPIGNRPIVDYIVQDCIIAGITDIYFVINETRHSQLMDYYGENTQLKNYLTERGKDASILDTAPSNVNFHYIAQPSTKYGTAVPIALVTEEFNLKEQVIMCNGDDPFWNVPSGSAVKDLIDEVANSEESAMTGLVRTPEEISKTGAMLDVENGFLKSLVEKPPVEKVTSNLMNINRFVFSPQLLKMIVDYVKTSDPTLNPRGEYEITDPVQAYVREGNPMRVVAAKGDWLESGSLSGWLHANEVIGRDLLAS